MNDTSTEDAPEQGLAFCSHCDFHIIYNVGTPGQTEAGLTLVEHAKSCESSPNVKRIRELEAADVEAAQLRAALIRDYEAKVQELERKLHHEGIEHSEAQERIIKLEAHAVELEREVANLKFRLERSNYCSHCGEDHPSHVGCSTKDGR